MRIFVDTAGSAGIEDHGYDVALANIKQFIDDCLVELSLIEPDTEKSLGGWYTFRLKAEEIPLDEPIIFTVKMLALPLDRIRYVNSHKQDPWDFHRLWVDDDSWLWKYAVITSEEIVRVLRKRLHDVRDEEDRGLLEYLIEQQSRTW